MTEDKIIVHVDEDLEALIPGFFENRHKDIKKMQEALEKEDFETIRIIGHSMKGFGAGYGFDAITDIGKSLEQAAKDEDHDLIGKWVKELSTYIESVEVVYD